MDLGSDGKFLRFQSEECRVPKGLYILRAVSGMKKQRAKGRWQQQPWEVCKPSPPPPANQEITEMQQIEGIFGKSPLFYASTFLSQSYILISYIPLPQCHLLDPER